MKPQRLFLPFIIASLLLSCSATKFIPEENYLLESVEVKSSEKGFDASALSPYIRQKANSKWFSVFKIPMATYALSGRDSTKWINRTLHRIGEKPVVYDSVQARISVEDLRQAMVNQGYMHASVDLQTRVRVKS